MRTDGRRRGEIQVYNCCTEFDAIDEEVAEAYKALFED